MREVGIADQKGDSLLILNDRWQQMEKEGELWRATKVGTDNLCGVMETKELVEGC